MPAAPFDIKLIIDPAGTPTEIGLMLVKPRDESKQYQITEQPVEGIIRDWVQRDFRGGIVGDKVLESETNAYASGQNFLAESRSGWLYSGPDFKEASTVASASFSGLGCVHDGVTSLFAPSIAVVPNNSDIYGSEATGTTFSLLKDTGTKGVRSLCSWGAYLLASASDGTSYMYSADDGSTWTTRTTATGSVQAEFIAAGDVLWGLLGPATMRWTTDPSNSGTWSGAFTVGPASANDGFVRGYYLAQMLLVIKKDGIYLIDDGGNVEKVCHGTWVKGATTDNTSKIFFYDGYADVWEYDIFTGVQRNLHFHEAIEGNLYVGGTLTNAGIEYALGRLFVTTPKGLWQWRQFRDQAGRLTSEAWESLYYNASMGTDLAGGVLPGHRLGTATLSSYPVYIGGSATATKLGYVRARRTEELDESGLTFTTVNSVVTSGVIDFGEPGERKILDYAEVELGGTSINCQVAYSIDDAAFANLGSSITSTGKTLLEFPSGTECYRLQLRLTNTPAANTNYVKLMSWRLRATLHPHFRRLVKINARCGDGLVLRNGSMHPQKGDTIRTNLHTARTTASRLQLQDLFGNDFDITILPPVVEVPSRDEHASDTESELQFSAIECGVKTAT